jgi:hypothetical protein
MGNLGGGASRRKDGVADGFGGGGSDSEMSDDENAFGRADDSGAMEITFAPGLSEKRGNEVMEEASEENTLDAYKRKMREKRKARKEERDAKFAGEAAEKEAGKSNRKDDGKGKKAAASPAGGDDFFGEESDDSGDVPPPSTNAKASKSKSSSSKPAPSTSAITTSTSSTDPSAKEAAFLDLLTLPTPGAIGKVDDSKHFSMTDIMKDEKAAGHKKRKRAPHSKKKGGEKDVELGDREFEIDVSDPRFSKKLNEDHRFAIDPSNPQYVSFLFLSAPSDFCSFPVCVGLRSFVPALLMPSPSFGFFLSHFPSVSRRPNRCPSFCPNALVCVRSKVAKVPSRSPRHRMARRMPAGTSTSMNWSGTSRGRSLLRLRQAVVVGREEGRREESS